MFDWDDEQSTSMGGSISIGIIDFCSEMADWKKNRTNMYIRTACIRIKAQTTRPSLPLSASVHPILHVKLMTARKPPQRLGLLLSIFARGKLPLLDGFTKDEALIDIIVFWRNGYLKWGSRKNRPMTD